MRLTLRTMLAYIDQILDPEDQATIGQKIAESEFATGLKSRISDVVERPQLAAPKLIAKGLAFDPNTVAEYLDNTLPAEQVPKLEQTCLESDVHLAEVASCHRVLSLVLSQPMEVDSALRRKMYGLGNVESVGAERVNAASTSTARPKPSKTPSTPASSTPVLAGIDQAVSQTPAPEAAGQGPEVSTKSRRRKPQIPDYLRETRSRKLWPIFATIGFLLASGLIVAMAVAPLNREHPVLVAMGLGPKSPELEPAPKANLALPVTENTTSTDASVSDNANGPEDQATPVSESAVSGSAASTQTGTALPLQNGGPSGVSETPMNGSSTNATVDTGSFAPNTGVPRETSSGADNPFAGGVAPVGSNPGTPASAASGTASPAPGSNLPLAPMPGDAGSSNPFETPTFAPSNAPSGPARQIDNPFDAPPPGETPSGTAPSVGVPGTPPTTTEATPSGGILGLPGGLSPGDLPPRFAEGFLPPGMVPGSNSGVGSGSLSNPSAASTAVPMPPVPGDLPGVPGANGAGTGTDAMPEDTSPFVPDADPLKTQANSATEGALPVDAAVRVGRLVSDLGVVLATFDKTADQWVRMPPLSLLNDGDQVLTLPTYRARLQLPSDLMLQIAGSTLVQVYSVDQSGTPAISLPFGRVIAMSVGSGESRLRLDLGGYVGVATFRDPESVLAIEVQRQFEVGEDPETTPGHVQVDLYVESGAVSWTDANGQTFTLTGPAHRTLGIAPGAADAQAVMPAWIRGEQVVASENRASTLFAQSLKPGAPVLLPLREFSLAPRIEQSLLATRSLALLDVYEPAIEGLGISTHRPYWSNYIDSLRSGLSRGPESATKVHEALTAKRGDSADALYRMLWGYTLEQLKSGEAEKLIDYLNHQALDYRVLAFDNLRSTLGTPRGTTQYQPEEAPLGRQQAVRIWREHLRSGRLFPQ